MSLAVPGQGGDAIAGLDSKRPQGTGDAAAARIELGIADPVDSIPLARSHHFTGRVPFGCMVQELVERERERLHASVDHRQAAASTSLGEMMPVFQFQG